MNYTAYEIHEGDCLEDVEALCAQLTIGGTFNDMTQPTGTTVERWLTLSGHWVAGLIAKNGYTVDQTEEAVLGILEELNALDVAIKCELANPITGLGEPNERFLELKSRRDEIIDAVENSQMLTVLGATSTTLGAISENLAISGTSRSRKASVNADPDYVQSRFQVGQGRNPRVSRVQSTESSVMEEGRPV